ncbi:MAG TPA: hypothetical protein VJX10_02150 [Pseudonocardiaceae bacterium]|nr:hypothetical protein [Pseudonocardiaceae bacterium]
MRRCVLGLVTAVLGAGIAMAGCQVPASTGSTGGASSPAPTAARQWRMPELVGAGLQQAQDAIQKITGDPLFVTSSHDATGRGRHQVIDSDWRVCSQNVAAGATFTMDTKIDFGAVKLAESCP